MNAAGLVPDNENHSRLLRCLAGSAYPENYMTLCSRYPNYGDIIGPKLDLKRVSEIFLESSVSTRCNKAWRVIYFDSEDVCGWSWEARLVIQRYNLLEPMGDVSSMGRTIGSTWLSWALHACEARVPPTPDVVFSPAAGDVNRPRFDGDMRTMERMVPDLVEFFRWTKGVVRENWPKYA